MKLLHSEAGVNLFLFQDEFFVSGKRQVMAFCDELRRSGLDVQWKAFGRVNLIDEEMMRAMADCGCLELRFGIESGSDRDPAPDQERLHGGRNPGGDPKGGRDFSARGGLLRLGISLSRPWRISTNRYFR